MSQVQSSALKMVLYPSRGSDDDLASGFQQPELGLIACTSVDCGNRYPPLSLEGLNLIRRMGRAKAAVFPVPVCA